MPLPHFKRRWTLEEIKENTLLFKSNEKQLEYLQSVLKDNRYIARERSTDFWDKKTIKSLKQLIANKFYDVVEEHIKNGNNKKAKEMCKSFYKSTPLYIEHFGQERFILAEKFINIGKPKLAKYLYEKAYDEDIYLAKLLKGKEHEELAKILKKSDSWIKSKLQHDY